MQACRCQTLPMASPDARRILAPMSWTGLSPNMGREPQKKLLESNSVFLGVELRGFEAGHFLQIVEALEVAVVALVLHDGVGLCRRDVENTRDLSRGRLVGIDLTEILRQILVDLLHL